MPPLSCDWAAYDDTDDGPVKSASYTDFTGHAIHLNPAPILDTAIDHGRALDVSVGFGLHEASHSQESRDRYKYLVKQAPHPNGKSMHEVPAFSPMRVAAYLWNLVEDVRIERVTSGHWPGFAPYFGAVLDYMWAQMRGRHELPETMGDGSIPERLRIVYLACRYPARFSPVDPDLAAEVAWWQAWQHDYLTDTVDTPTTIQRGLDHLAEDVTTMMQMGEEAKAEKHEREAGERLRAQIDRLIREGIKGGYELCIVEQGEVVPLDAETAEAVRKLVREGLVEHRVTITARGVSNAPVHVRKPEETKASRRAYVGRPDATTEALRAALVFRPSAPEHAEKLLTSGSIDDEELYRWGMNDLRVFGRREIESKPDVLMALLVDSSGSMYGHKLEIAQRLAQLFVWAVHDQVGIETQVWAHTADITYDVAEVFRIWAPGDPLTRLGLITELDHGNNRDGNAIEAVVRAMVDREQPEKVLVVLSDGIPSGNGYGGPPAMDHVRAVTRWAASRGVRVMQVAIDPRDLRPAEQYRMYGQENVILFRGYDQLPRQIAAVLGRYLS